MRDRIPDAVRRRREPTVARHGQEHLGEKPREYIDWLDGGRERELVLQSKEHVVSGHHRPI